MPSEEIFHRTKLVGRKATLSTGGFSAWFSIGLESKQTDFGGDGNLENKVEINNKLHPNACKV